ncbi:nickel transport system ATP-binding protein [Paenibacillus endophyticus]|uniref:Nickel transport system ATP-binding protein n=1 Tax=Paenibacillus endophyticus TaxID=1294268 RepID=A0A7W5GDB2_9BACL|nr:ABC transporter ATP-binding protein [Paenibacillus endophyticus]MBB3155273.1 nickel transport system ATP-binding protein [Paenibacillus endophyticus]
MLKVEGVNKSYRQTDWFRKARNQVLRDIGFEWRQGETLGIIGESGSGKSTLGRLLLGIEEPDSGIITFGGKPISDRSTRRGAISAVFQDYTSSINPFFTVRQAILEPLRLAGTASRPFDIGKLLRQVGLDESYLTRYPHELSGGEAQRVCIARAVSAEPQCILLDEAISSLDGSVQMQVLELLKQLRTSYGMGYIFITHDIQAAAYLCDRVMIICGGEMVELVETEELKHVQSPYAKELLSKVIS